LHCIESLVTALQKEKTLGVLLAIMANFARDQLTINPLQENNDVL
jgi:hypothetical protein